MIAGLEEISQGDLFIGGQRMNDVAPARRGIAMVFQSYALFPHLTMYENMAFDREAAEGGHRQQGARSSTRAAAGPVSRTQAEGARRGQRQRVAIGRAIVCSPKAFLFDEPLESGHRLRVQTRIEIARLHRKFSEASMVYVTCTTRSKP